MLDPYRTETLKWFISEMLLKQEQSTLPAFIQNSTQQSRDHQPIQCCIRSLKDPVDTAVGMKWRDQLVLNLTCSNLHINPKSLPELYAGLIQNQNIQMAQVNSGIET